MTPEELKQVGESLYGTRWQTKLARELPINVRTLRRWLSGEVAIRPIVANRIRDIANHTPLKNK